MANSNGKGIGVTELSGAGGSVIGIALATIIMALIPAVNSPELFGAVAVVCSVVCTLAAGWLSPSQEAALAPFLDEASNRFASKVPSADEVAEATHGKLHAHLDAMKADKADKAAEATVKPVKAPEGDGESILSVQGEKPADVSERVDSGDAGKDYPDLNALAEQERPAGTPV